MSVWIKVADKLPKLGEEVLILYKLKGDKLTEDNLFYAVSNRFRDSMGGFERWSYFTECQNAYEVVFWTPLVDMPRIEPEDTRGDQNLKEQVDDFLDELR